MPAPPAVPRRTPLARRPPLRPQPRQRTVPVASRVIVAIGAVAAVAGAAAWLMNDRAPSSLKSAAQAAASEPTATAGVEPAEPAPAEVTQAQVEQALAEAPLLAPEAARALLVESARRGQTRSHALDDALFVASVGFSDLDRATLDELGDLFSRGWAARSAADQGRIQAYMRYARDGEPLSLEAVVSGRALFLASVRSLPAAAQGRLSALFAKAVATGIAHQQQAEERARLASLAPVPAVETPPPAERTPMSALAMRNASRPTAGASDATAAPGTTPSGQGFSTSDPGPATRASSESYWRSRAASARAALAAAEKNVHDLEEEARRAGPVVSGPLPPACQASAPVSKDGHPSGSILGPSAFERVKSVQHCDGEILRQQQARGIQQRLDAARESLGRARKSYEAMEEEARRAGARPGWLR